ncbi:MAG: anti-sigma factor family protein [Blastocatellia bacterium]
MDCVRFQDQISDYVDGAMDGCAKAEFAAHRLRCRECREVFADVRDAVGSLREMAGMDHLGEAMMLENRILEATSAGEMLSCQSFDRLIERYFDGVILAPTFQQFQEHFRGCHKCRRLMAGIDDAIELFAGVREEQMPVSQGLHDRIMAATTAPGAEAPRSWFHRHVFVPYFQSLWTPQWAVATLIFAASTFLIDYSFGGFSEMAETAGAKAGQIVEQGNQAISMAGVMAVTGVTGFSGRGASKAVSVPTPLPADALRPSALMYYPAQTISGRNTGQPPMSLPPYSPRPLSRSFTQEPLPYPPYFWMPPQSNAGTAPENSQNNGR